MTDLNVGLDLGSTWVKALAFDPAGEQVALVRRRTPWTSLPGGLTETTAEAIEAAVRALLVELDAEIEGHRVVSVGISGMAEAGVLLDADGTAAAPVPAWFDPRGAEEIRAASPAVIDEFSAVTGLPVNALCTFAKLLHHRKQGLDLAGLTWLNVPEYAAHLLGGGRYGERSLTARTGLIDQDTEEPWAPALEALDVTADLLPERRSAGDVWGHATGVPASMTGAVITVAGHDHLVASVAAGAVQPHQLYDSMGTAEALVRVLEEPLPRERRAALAEVEVDTVRHLLPGRSTLLASCRTGLALRRVLNLVGVTDAAGRDVLDAAVMALPDDQDLSSIEVTGAEDTSSTLTIHVVDDDVSPALLFATALAHADHTLAAVVDRLDAEVGPATQTIVAGGWAGMAAVQRARRALLPGVTFSVRSEDTAHGAALIGAFACTPSENDLAHFIAMRLA
jgi:sugar (pentulose or hexulose) kinase